MAEIDYDIIQGEYLELLEILEKLDAYLVILEKPLIGLSAHAWRIIDELECVCSSCSLPQEDKDAVEDFIHYARRFCNGFFEQHESEDLPAVCPLRLPNDSRSLLKAHNRLHQQCLDLTTNIRVSLRNLKAELHII